MEQGIQPNKQKLCELNVWTSNKKQQNKCVSWSKGFLQEAKVM